MRLDAKFRDVEDFMWDSPPPDEITPESYWRTQDGKRIRILDMSDRHLLATIRVLRNLSPIGTTFRTTPECRRRWLNAMANEAYKRGFELDEITENEPVHE